MFDISSCSHPGLTTWEGYQVGKKVIIFAAVNWSMVKIDQLDRSILNLIIDNARVPFKDIADMCGVSRAAVHQRVTRMIENGVITGSGYKVDYKKLGYTTYTYVGIKLEKGSLYKEVAAQIHDIPEVVECHYTTGLYSILIKLYARDNDHLMKILSEQLQEIRGVVSTETMISLTETFSRSFKLVDPIEEEEQ